jgi:lipid II:glycine glycyltransferase (peptidoglycan interpeptide bridge formation enzyme)
MSAPTVQISERPPREIRERIADLVARSSVGHFLQYPGWEDEEHMRGARRLCAWVEADGTVQGSAEAVLYRPRRVAPLVARVERGPVAERAEVLSALLESLAGELRKRGVASWRVNPYHRLDGAGELLGALKAGGFRPAPDDEAYASTLEADLEAEPERLLSGFSKRHRWSVRKATREGVACTSELEAEAVEAFSRLYAEMVVRKGATARPSGFFRELAGMLERHPERGFLLTARFRGEIVGGIFVLRHGRRAIYAYGASSDVRDGVPKTHLLHFEAMRRAREMGCTGYDLGGFSAGTGSDESRSVVQNINLFKNGFTKNVVPLVPCHEQVLRPLLHRGLAGARRAYHRWRGRHTAAVRERS